MCFRSQSGWPSPTAGPISHRIDSANIAAPSGRRLLALYSRRLPPLATDTRTRPLWSVTCLHGNSGRPDVQRDVLMEASKLGKLTLLSRGMAALNAAVKVIGCVFFRAHGCPYIGNRLLTFSVNGNV